MRTTRAVATVVIGVGAFCACNALSGVGDLDTCAGCVEAGDAAAADSAPDLGSDAAGDALPPTCRGSEKRCAGKTAARCVSGAWQTTPCAETCLDGDCAPEPSCRNASGTGCGASPTSCCASAAVPGGTFDRRNDPAYVATVSPFALDVFEVTVGRFRAFVDATGGATRASPPPAGAGAHPRISGSGWLDAWDGFLPLDTATLRNALGQATLATWTKEPGPNEHLPIAGLSWFEAFAFCAWDGGRLPTYAEWTFAAAGGAEQRIYPWSATSAIDTNYASYSCARVPPPFTCPPCHCSSGAAEPCDATCIAPSTYVYPPCYGCDLVDIAPVGSYPKGAGKWGHLDLAGNVAELTLDSDPSGMKGGGALPPAPLPVPCTDCAALLGATPASVGKNGTEKAFLLVPGGGFRSAPDGLRTTSFDDTRFDEVADSRGFRCARD